MPLVDEELAASGCVISVMGAHAGEDADVIFGRKIDDCETVGRTFWVAKSAKARPPQVQAICNPGPGYVIFVEPVTPGGARPTTESDSATEYSPNRTEWLALPNGIGPVTGQMDGAATALVFDRLTIDVDRTIDLWAYADAADPDRPLKFALGLSAACAMRKDTSAHPQRMKSRYRRVVAVGGLRIRTVSGCTRSLTSASLVSLCLRGTPDPVARALSTVTDQAFVVPDTAELTDAETAEVERIIEEVATRSFRNGMSLTAALVAFGGLTSAALVKNPPHAGET